jgi:hypothetical protein
MGLHGLIQGEEKSPLNKFELTNEREKPNK